jgi:hypothetical protein
LALDNAYERRPLSHFALSHFRNGKPVSAFPENALPVSFVVANSGGIVGLGGPFRLRLDGDAPLGLGLAPLEIFPQRRRQALLLPGPLSGLAAAAYPAAFAHETRLRRQGAGRKIVPGRACAPCGLVAMIARLRASHYSLIIGALP